MCESIELLTKRYYSESDGYLELFNLIKTQSLHQYPNVHDSGFYLTCDGKICSPSYIFRQGCNIRINLRLCGGKGGFGTMLKTMGSRMGRSTNQDSCRTLEGRRLKDVKNDRRIRDWKLKHADDKEEDKSEVKVTKLKKIIEGADPKNIETNTKMADKYFKNIENATESVTDAVSTALAQSRKRKESPSIASSSAPKMKKNLKLMWGLDDITDSESDNDEHNEVDGKLENEEK